MAVRFTVPTVLPERTTWRYTASLVDDQNAPIPIWAITTLTLTLYVDSGLRPIINGVQNLDIKNVGRGTLGLVDGSLTIKFEPGDMAILDDTLKVENHIALISCTYNGGQDAFNHEVYHKVTNFGRLS